MHEAAHWLLFTSHRVTNGAARWLCAYPLFEDLPRYRRSHHLHHRHTRQAEDPDLALAAPYPATRGALIRAALRDLSGWTALTRRSSAGGPGASQRPRGAGCAARSPPTRGCSALLAAAGHWPLFPLLWLLPMLTWYPARDAAPEPRRARDGDGRRRPAPEQPDDRGRPGRPRADRAVLGQLSPRAPPAGLRALLAAPASPRVCSSPRGTGPGWSERTATSICSGGLRAPIVVRARGLKS